MLMEGGKVLDGGQDGGFVHFVDKHFPNTVGLGLPQPDSR